MRHFLSHILSEDKICLSVSAKSFPIVAARERGAIQIGKLNTLLFALILVILITLIFKDDPGEQFANDSVTRQTEVLIDGVPEVSAEVLTESEPTVHEHSSATKSEAEPETVSNKPHKQHSKQAAPSVEDAQPVEHVPSMPANPAHDQLDVEDSHQHATTKILMFNIWSISELRLRRAYSNYMNDSNVSALQLEARKKEYLAFVAVRTRKCGELDNKFTSNINSVEKISFVKGDVALLECHSQANNAELEKLNQ